MSRSLHVVGYYGKDNSEFKKHYNAVKFCVENDLSLPIETRNFFEGKFDDDLDDLHKDAWIEYVQDGFEVEIDFTEDEDYRKVIDVRTLPKDLDTIVVEIS